MKQKKSLFPLISVVVIALLIGITAYNWRGSLKRNTGLVIAQDVAHLATILEDINNTAGILGFDRQKNDINFLNIKKDGFIGSELGSMNLIHPNRWQGPYEKEMPRMQEEDYMIVRTRNGYWITPGEGVRLPNGKIIGKDLILDEDADIESMIQEGQSLNFQGRALASKIAVAGARAVIPSQPIVVEED